MSMTENTTTQTTMPMQKWDIRIKNLHGGYEDHLIFSNLNATIKGGNICALLGESGCGKSTLLRMILGLTPPTMGEIHVGKYNLTKMNLKEFRKFRRRFGVLFQDGALLGSLNLWENVALPLSEHTKLSEKVRKEAALRVLELVGLKDFADYYPAELSGGMKKRAGLARAIITEPPILFCDEPTSGLDPITSAQMDQLLLDMKSYYPEMTIVLITHDLASVQSIAQNVLLLHKGKSVFNGTKEEFYASENEYAMQFLARKAIEEKRMTTTLSQEVRDALDSWIEK